MSLTLDLASERAVASIPIAQDMGLRTLGPFYLKKGDLSCPEEPAIALPPYNAPMSTNCSTISKILLPMWLSAILLTLGIVSSASAAEFVCSGGDLAPPSPAGKTLQSISRFNPSEGRVKALMIFAQFADEGSPSDRAPAFAAALFDPSRPGL